MATEAVTAAEAPRETSAPAKLTLMTMSMMVVGSMVGAGVF